MIRKLAAAGAIAAALLAVSTLSYAGDFPAAPLNAGPPNLPGQHIIPGLDEAVGLANSVTQPILQPILVPGAEPASPVGAEPVKHHRARRHYVSRKLKHKAA